MTVASTPSSLLTIDGYVLDAYKKSGLLPIEAEIGFDDSWNAKATHGRRILNRLLEGLARKGFIQHFESFTIVDMVADQAQYIQGTHWDTDGVVLNIHDTGNYIPESNDPEEVETTGETPVSPMSVHQWGMLANKSATGTPTKYFLHRNGPSLLNLYIWPIPTEAGKIRFRTLRIPGSSDVGSNDVDLKRQWGEWLVHALAYEIMTDSKLPLDERTIVRDDRDRIMAEMMTSESSNEGPDMIFTHATGWTNF